MKRALAYRGPDWWRSFNEAALGLRDALEEEKARGNRQPLSDQEQEQAPLLLIRAAYFLSRRGLPNRSSANRGGCKEGPDLGKRRRRRPGQRDGRGSRFASSGSVPPSGEPGPAA